MENAHLGDYRSGSFGGNHLGLNLILNGEVDLTPLSGLVNLKELRLYGSLAVEDFTALSGMTDLQTLRLEVAAAGSMAGLESLTKLQELSISNSGSGSGVGIVSDVSFLAGMTELQILSLATYQLPDFQGMEQLTNLRDVRLYGSQSGFMDVDPLQGATKIQVLQLPSRNPELGPFDISGLAGMTELTELTMDHRVTSLEPLRNLTKMKKLNINGGTDRDNKPAASFDSIEPLSGMTELTELTVMAASGMGNDYLKPLAGLTNLQRLNLYTHGSSYDPPLTDISPLGNLTRLQSLYLLANGLSDLSPLKNCTSLTDLTIRQYGGKNITDLSPVSHVTNVSVD
ncbi:MAG: hypothetical protein ACLTKI_01515 [Lachnospiraceae bacterium]